MHTVTFIGNGNMALAIAQGLKHKYRIEVVGRTPEHLDAFEEKLGVSIEKHDLEGFDIDDKHVILCVKPANLKTVGKQLKGKAKLLLSVLAGTPLSALEKAIKAKGYVRAMPNLAARYGASMTTLTGDAEHKEEALVLMRGAGEVLWLESEKELDIATALAGSGPAYLAVVAEALADGAVRLGLKREDARKLTEGLFEGAAKLISHEHPASVKEEVMSPGGTTAAGCVALEAHAVRAAFIDALDAAYARACELSN
jgi:pyrroline-5-carboxylate reductase